MVQLMVPKDIMVQALQDMGHSVPQLEQQLQSIAWDVVEAASVVEADRMHVEPPENP